MEERASSEITRLLDAVRDGDPAAQEALLAHVYNELRELARAKMARERPGNTLQATALVHEAWLRLGDQRFNNRAHFFGAAAEAMRRILIERARRRLAEKRGGGAGPERVEPCEIATAPEKEAELIIVHDALEALEAHDRRKAELVKLRYFVGLTFEQAAKVLEVSVPTVKRDWTYARAWLHRALSDGV
ncbi:MAG: sigma-70 family RNA polymerase sigma factor [Planctomycetota bacterium]